jgi:hypothetical protein
MDPADALSVLTDALARCPNEEMWNVGVFAALDALAANANTRCPLSVD